MIAENENQKIEKIKCFHFLKKTIKKFELKNIDFWNTEKYNQGNELASLWRYEITENDRILTTKFDFSQKTMVSSFTNDFYSNFCFKYNTIIENHNFVFDLI